MINKLKTPTWGVNSKIPDNSFNTYLPRVNGEISSFNLTASFKILQSGINSVYEEIAVDRPEESLNNIKYRDLTISNTGIDDSFVILTRDQMLIELGVLEPITKSYVDDADKVLQDQIDDLIVSSSVKSSGVEYDGSKDALKTLNQTNIDDGFYDKIFELNDTKVDKNHIGTNVTQHFGYGYKEGLTLDTFTNDRLEGLRLEHNSNEITIREWNGVDFSSIDFSTKGSDNLVTKGYVDKFAGGDAIFSSGEKVSELSILKLSTETTLPTNTYVLNEINQAIQDNLDLASAGLEISKAYVDEGDQELQTQIDSKLDKEFIGIDNTGSFGYSSPSGDPKFTSSSNIDLSKASLVTTPYDLSYYMNDTSGNPIDYIPIKPESIINKKYVDDKVGDLITLATTAKDNLVNAINEVNAKPTSTGGASTTTELTYDGTNVDLTGQNQTQIDDTFRSDIDLKADTSYVDENLVLKTDLNYTGTIYSGDIGYAEAGQPFFRTTDLVSGNFGQLYFTDKDVIFSPYDSTSTLIEYVPTTQNSLTNKKYVDEKEILLMTGENIKDLSLLKTSDLDLEIPTNQTVLNEINTAIQENVELGSAGLDITKAYVDLEVANVQANLDNAVAAQTTLNDNFYKIGEVENPLIDNDAANKFYTDFKDNTLQEQINALIGDGASGTSITEIARMDGITNGAVSRGYNLSDYDYTFLTYFFTDNTTYDKVTILLTNNKVMTLDTSGIKYFYMLSNSTTGSAWGAITAGSTVNNLSIDPIQGSSARSFILTGVNADTSGGGASVTLSSSIINDRLSLINEGINEDLNKIDLKADKTDLITTKIKDEEASVALGYAVYQNDRNFKFNADINNLNTNVGILGNLETTAKDNLVNAINEVNAKPTSTGGASTTTELTYDGTNVDLTGQNQTQINDSLKLSLDSEISRATNTENSLDNKINAVKVVSYEFNNSTNTNPSVTVGDDLSTFTHLYLKFKRIDSDTFTVATIATVLINFNNIEEITFYSGVRVKFSSSKQTVAVVDDAHVIIAIYGW